MTARRRSCATVAGAFAASVVALGAPAVADAAYGFSAHDILVQQTALQYNLNHGPLAQALKLLDPSAKLPPVAVRCHGVTPVTFTNGAKGYLKIRCTTSLPNGRDYLYSRDAKGRVLTRRISPGAP